MKKLVALFLAAILALSLAGTALADDTPTLRVFVVLHTEQTTEAKDLFFFKYLSRLYNVNFEVESMKTQDDVASKMATMWNDLPDIVLTSTNADEVMKYGVDQGLMLDFMPYLNEETMPNALKAREEYAVAFDSVIAPDGGLYALPYIRGYVYANNTGAFSANERLFINMEWVKAVGKEMPTTLDELIDVLRAIKEQDPGQVGEKLVPALSNGNKLNEQIWNALGYYAGGTQQYGSDFAIKNAELVIPAYTADAKLFLETMKTLYDEGLISPDFFTLDSDANNALATQGVAGMIGTWTMECIQNNYAAWDVVGPLTSAVSDNQFASVNLPVSFGSFASADTKYPELVAKICDWFYSDEGAVMYQMGPMEGSEAAALVPECNAWYIKDIVGEDGTATPTIVNALTDPDSDKYDATYTLTNGNTGNYYIGGKFDLFRTYPFVMAGREDPAQFYESTDKVTGAKVSMLIEDPNIFLDDNWDRHWRVTQTNAWKDNLTFVRLPGVMLSPEDTERANYLRTGIQDYINAQSAAFIAGRRSLDEFDAYQEELKNLGIEEFIGIYQNAYAGWLTNTFGE